MGLLSDELRMLWMRTCVEMRKHCFPDSFNVTCARDEVIVMTAARYGRMSKGQCLTSDYQVTSDYTRWRDSELTSDYHVTSATTRWRDNELTSDYQVTSATTRWRDSAWRPTTRWRPRLPGEGTVPDVRLPGRLLGGRAASRRPQVLWQATLRHHHPRHRAAQSSSVPERPFRLPRVRTRLPERYTLCLEKTPHLWLAIIFTYAVRLQDFWQKCCGESRQSERTLFFTSPN